MGQRWVVSLVFVSALLCVFVATVFMVPGPASTVRVSAVNLYGPTGCGIASQLAPGFNAPAGGQEQFSAQVFTELGGCVVDSVIAATPGFQVIATNAPLVVTPTSATLWWIVQLPLSFQGNLTLNFIGTSSGISPTAPSGCASPCISSHVPSELYQYNFGEALPSGWIAFESAAAGGVIASVAWARKVPDVTVQ